MDTVGQRIKALRLQLRMTQQAFADAVGGVTRGAVGNWERDQGIKTENLLAISEAFKISMDWLSQGSTEYPGMNSLTVASRASKFLAARELEKLKAARRRGERLGNAPRYPIMNSVPIVGEVAAGAWREPDELDEPPETDVSVNPDPRWAEYFQRAWLVRGRSIERVARDGDVLIGVVLGEAPIQPQDGDLVIAERIRQGGGLVERTAKRLRLASGGLSELVPEYMDAELNLPIDLGAGNDEVRIVAVVVGIYRPLR